MIKVYIAGPINGSGRQFDNLRAALAAGSVLLEKGFAPFVPHLNLHWDLACPFSPDVWQAWDDEWLRQCDALLRLPGESPGSDHEERLARALGIPVYYDLDQLLEEMRCTH